MLPAIADMVRRDIEAFRDGDANALILENFGDVPIPAGRVDAATVAQMTRLALIARDTAPALPLGINLASTCCETMC